MALAVAIGAKVVYEVGAAAYGVEVQKPSHSTGPPEVEEATDTGRRPAAKGAPGATRARLSGVVNGAFALGVAVVFLVASVGRSGVWDPHELDRADLARRLAVHLFGAAELRVEGVTDVMPTLGDLGMGELPFTSMGLGFSLLGLHDYAGRLPLALWALGGALLLYLLLARLVSRRAGLYGVVVLCTMPLYFVQARTMLGDVVTMVAHLACFGGLLGAMLDARATRRSQRIATIGAWLLVAAVGTVAGYLSRGAIIGVAAPALGVGLCWLCALGAGLGRALGRGARAFHAVGLVACGVGLLALGVGVDALLSSDFGDRAVQRVLGFAFVTKPPAETTFELTVRDLGHALFPWSAFLPFAVGRIFLRRPTSDADAGARDALIRVALLVGSATAYGAVAWLAPYAGAIAYPAPALLAAIAAVVLHDFARGASPSPIVAAGTLLLAVLLWRDMVNIPVKALSAYGVSERTLPKDVEGAGAGLMLAAAVVFSVVTLLAWMERGQPAVPIGGRRWLRERLGAYRAGARSLAQLWRGNLLFGLLVTEAALVGLGAMLYVGRRVGWTAVERFPHNASLVAVNAWWVLPLVPVAGLVAFEVSRAGFAWLLRQARLPRATAMALGALVAGGILCFGFYPALAAQLSPKEVFQRYAALHEPGQPLGVLGLRARAAEFYAQGEHVEPLTSPRAAHHWLAASVLDDPISRRWLVLRSKDLPELNSFYRAATRANVPIVDAAAGTILLASNELGGLPNQNWLEPFVRSEVGSVQHPVAATFEDKLETLGWDVVDERGSLVEYVVPQRTYRMRFYYRVLGRITRNYKAFLHIDGHRRRHNGDHDVLRGEYGMNRWLPGDVIVDEYRLRLEPNFTPASYTVYYGFFQGKSRFEVREGKHHDNRVNGGRLIVR